MRSSPLCLALLALTACSASEIRTLDLTQAPDGVAVVLLINGDGRAARALPPFGLQQGRVTFGDAPRVFLGRDETRAVWLHLDPEALRVQYPRLDLTRLAELQIRIEPPPEQANYGPSSASGSVQATSALPSQAILAFDEAGRPVDLGGLQLELTLEVWLDPQVCAEPGRGRFKAYGSVHQPFADLQGVTEAWILAAAPLDENHVVIGGLGIAVVPRGQPFVPSASNWLSPQDLLGVGLGELMAHDIAVQPGLQWPRRAWVAVQHPQGGALLELELGPQDLRLVRTATVTSKRLLSVDVDEAGRAAVMGDGGLVLIVDGGRVLPISLPFGTETSGPEKTHVLWTGDALEPLLAGSASAIHGLEPALDAWTATGLPVFAQRGRVRGLVRRGSEVFVASNMNTLFRRLAPTDYEGLQPVLGPGMRPCGRREPESLVFLRQHIDGLALAEDATFLVYDDCSIAVRLRADGCASSILAPEGEPAIVNWSHKQVFEHQGRFVVATSRGDLWVSEVE